MLGVSVSIPLSIRNGYRAEVRAAQAEADVASRRGRTGSPCVRVQPDQNAESYRAAKSAWDDWRDSRGTDVERRASLLERSRREGEARRPTTCCSSAKPSTRNRPALHCRRRSEGMRRMLDATDQQALGLAPVVPVNTYENRKCHDRSPAIGGDDPLAIAFGGCVVNHSGCPPAASRAQRIRPRPWQRRRRSRGSRRSKAGGKRGSGGG